MIRTRFFLAGLAGAAVTWTAAFRGNSRFWEKMTVGVGSLGALALVANPRLRRQRPALRDAVAGTVSAATLYLVFQVGDRMARRIMPNGAAEIDSVYERRQLGSVRFIAPALALVIAPGEELFWRGLVNEYLMQRLGRVRGSLAGSFIYGGIHTVTGNLTLTGAAGVAGAFWSAQNLLEGRIWSLIASHALWDVWIFLVQPTTAGRERAG